MSFKSKVHTVSVTFYVDAETRTQAIIEVVKRIKQDVRRCENIETWVRKFWKIN